MTKFLRNLMLVGATLFLASNISAQAPLYVTGGGDALGNWTPGSPTEFAYANGVYTLELDETASEFKISTTKGTWDEFNAGNLTPNATIENGVAVSLSVNKDGGNIVLPWAGAWTITVDLTAMTFKAVTETPKPEVSNTPLYMVGYNGAWDPANPTEIPYDATKGVYFLASVEFTNTICKISKTKGTWDQFNAGGMCSSNDALVKIGVPGSLYLQYCGDIPIEATGTYDLTIDLVNKTIFLEGAVVYPDALFLCGNLADANWDPAYDGAILDPIEDGIYTIESVELVAVDGNANAYFSFNTTVGSWDDVNAAIRYGADSSDKAVTIGENMPIVAGSNSWMVEPGTYDLTVNLNNMTLVVAAAASGIESIEANENIPAVYYNLQGIKVTNPSEGIFIKVQGNKVTKVVK